MNAAQFNALIWEHCRRSLVPVVTVTLLLAGVDVAWQLLARNMEEPFVDDPIVILGFGMFAGLIFQLVSNTSVANLQFSVNPFYLRLPVNTLHFAFARMVLGAATLCIITVVLHEVHFEFIIQPPESVWFEWKLNKWFLLTMVISAYAVTQLIAWATGQWVTIAMLAAVFYGCIAGFTPWAVRGDELGPIHVMYATGVLCICAVLGSFALRVSRSGEQLPVYGHAVAFVQWLWSRFDSMSEIDAVEFASRTDALLWLERRYMRNLFPYIFLFFLLLTGLAAALDMRGWGAEDLGMALIGTMLAAAVVAGVFFTLIALRRHSSGAQSFVLTKPATIQEVVESRFRAMFSQMIVPGVLLQVALVGLVATELLGSGSLDGLPIGGSVPAQVIFLYLMYLGVMVLAWCALWCAQTFPIALWWVYLFAGFFFAMGEMKMLSDGHDLPGWAHRTVLMLTLLPVAAFWVRGLMRGLIPYAGIVLFSIPILLAVVYAALELVGFSGAGENNMSAIAIVTAGALLPFALVPQFVEHQRHH